MAELEIIKHAKKAHASMNSDNTIWHKTKEILIEIFIIVFAVTLSIWFHSWSEHRHQQMEVKQFLTGLKEDLQNDISEMNKDKESYIKQQKVFTYLYNLKIKENIAVDTMKKHGRWIFNTTALNPNAGRFEGFKSSGKIGSIENSKLQTDIMDLYQENIPALLGSTSGYIEGKKKLLTYIELNNVRITDSTSNLLQVLTHDRAHNLYFYLQNTDEIQVRYDSCIAKSNAILRQIEETFDL
jgi:hypothetical protein